jgi:hypothetical protein
MRGAIPPLPNTPSWFGTPLKKSTGQLDLKNPLNAFLVLFPYIKVAPMTSGMTKRFIVHISWISILNLNFLFYYDPDGIATSINKAKLSLFLAKHHAMKTYWGSGGIVPIIFDLGARRRLVVSFTLRPLYPQGKSPRYPLDRRLGGLQSRSGRCSEEKNSQPPPGIES